MWRRQHHQHSRWRSHHRQPCGEAHRHPYGKGIIITIITAITTKTIIVLTTEFPSSPLRRSSSTSLRRIIYHHHAYGEGPDLNRTDDGDVPILQRIFAMHSSYGYGHTHMEILDFYEVAQCIAAMDGYGTAPILDFYEVSQCIAAIGRRRCWIFTLSGGA